MLHLQRISWLSPSVADFRHIDLKVRRKSRFTENMMHKIKIIQGLFCLGLDLQGDTWTDAWTAMYPIFV